MDWFLPERGQDTCESRCLRTVSVRRSLSLPRVQDSHTWQTVRKIVVWDRSQGTWCFLPLSRELETNNTQRKSSRTKDGQQDGGIRCDVTQNSTKQSIQQFYTSCSPCKSSPAILQHVAALHVRKTRKCAKHRIILIVLAASVTAHADRLQLQLGYRKTQHRFPWFLSVTIRKFPPVSPLLLSVTQFHV
jgi:hypothetical protein